MTENLKIKIRGFDPISILLALSLAKLNHKIYLLDLPRNDSLNSKDIAYFINHSSRKILKEFNLWDSFKSIIYGFDSISIDSTNYKNLILSVDDLNQGINTFKNIGWVVEHSSLIKFFFSELSNYENISVFDSENQFKMIKNFDYEFISEEYNSSYKSQNNTKFFKRTFNYHRLSFKVLLRGAEAKRTYKLIRKDGILLALPLSDDLYQIIWTSNSLKSLKRLNISRGLLLDNLCAAFQNKIHFDQIIGEVNSYPVSYSCNTSFYTLNNHIFLNESFERFQLFGIEGLNYSFKEVFEIYKLFLSLKITNKYYLKYLKLKFYSNKFLNKSFLFFINNLIRLFFNTNLFMLFNRNFYFLLLNKFLILRRLILNLIIKSFF